MIQFDHFIQVWGAVVATVALFGTSFGYIYGLRSRVDVLQSKVDAREEDCRAMWDTIERHHEDSDIHRNPSAAREQHLDLVKRLDELKSDVVLLRAEVHKVDRAMGAMQASCVAYDHRNRIGE